MCIDRNLMENNKILNYFNRQAEETETELFLSIKYLAKLKLMPHVRILHSNKMMILSVLLPYENALIMTFSLLGNSMLYGSPMSLIISMLSRT